jgi:hypothetical protein
MGEDHLDPPDYRLYGRATTMSQMSLIDYATWLQTFSRKEQNFPKGHLVHPADRNMIEAASAALIRASKRIDMLKAQNFALMYGSVVQVTPPKGSHARNKYGPIPDEIWRQVDLLGVGNPRTLEYYKQKYGLPKPSEETPMRKFEAFDRTKPKFRIFQESTVKGEVQASPHAYFYDTFEEAEQRCAEILETCDGPLHIFMTVAVVEPKKPKRDYTTTLIAAAKAGRAVRRKKTKR